MCDSNFSQKGNLNEHISAIHEVIQTVPKKSYKMETYLQFMKERNLSAALFVKKDLYKVGI